MAKVKKVKQMQKDGTFIEVPIGANAENIDMANGKNLEEELDEIKITNTAFLQKISNLYVLPTTIFFEKEKINQDFSNIEIYVNGEKLNSNDYSFMSVSDYDILGYNIILHNFYEDGSVVEVIYTKMIATKNEDYEFLRGSPGYTPYIGENGNWWINEEDTGFPTVAVPNVLTQAEYDSLDNHDENTLYYIKEE